jgi:hypothetical protein
MPLPDWDETTLARNNVKKLAMPTQMPRII